MGVFQVAFSRTLVLQPKVILSASAGVEPKGAIPYKPILDEAIQLADWTPKACLIFKRPNLAIEPELVAGRDGDWATAVGEAEAVEDAVPVDSSDPVYLIHTSGTTGVPKVLPFIGPGRVARDM